MIYLEHFGLKEQPFSLTPNTHFYCGLDTHQAALNVLLVSLKSGDGFIKITGEVGTGKTLLCRKLLDKLDEKFITAYLLNPKLTPIGLYKSIANELGINLEKHFDQQMIQEKMNDRLIECNSRGKQVVLIIDESQTMEDETLEALRLLTNLETGSKKLLQIVLFAQPELDERLQKKEMRQLRQRITFSHKLLPLKKPELTAYLNHRLATAGYTYGVLFNKRAYQLLFRASHGIPRVINILCHKAMLSAYGRNKKQVDAKSMLEAIKDSDNIVYQHAKRSKKMMQSMAIGSIVIVIILAAFISQHVFLRT